MSTIHSPRYRQFLKKLRAARLDAGLTQQEAARALRKPQSFVSKCESGERRVDVVEGVDANSAERRNGEMGARSIIW